VAHSSGLTRPSLCCPGMAEDPDPVEQAWAQLVEQWEEAEAHRRFLGLCAALGRLPEAGSRYRNVRNTAADPERRAIAEQQIDRLLAFAVSTLEQVRTDPGPHPARPVLLAVGVVLTALMVGLTTWLVLHPGW
jgi:hypothetical protein